MNAALLRLCAAPIAALFMCCAAALATAAPLAESDEVQIRQVIFAQLTAFADDDADGAFEKATPAVREAIGSSGRFLAMVRGSYPMVYRSSSVSFKRAQVEADSVLQMVEIVDDDNKAWLAVYELEKQPDNSWRISACVVAESRWKSV